MRRRAVALAIILALALGLVPLISPGAIAQGRTEWFLARLHGESEVPGPGDSDGSGKAYLTLVNNRMCWVLNWFHIGAPTAAHIHAGRATVAGPIVQPLFTSPQGVPAPIERAAGCVDLDPALADAIAARPRNFYVNIHTARFPAGALRGQLLRRLRDFKRIRPVRHYPLIAAPMNGEKEVPPADLDGHGRTHLGNAGVRTTLCFKLFWWDIAPPVAAHIHRGPPRVNGPVVVPFFSAPGGLPSTIDMVGGCVRDLDFRLTGDIREHPGQYYVNVHTAEFPDGAIRAQIRVDRGD